ncbi:MAG: hypothetical protein QGF46_03910, partial [Planctomycetota bacterium]|nr:hypothetical protein [Planctomycetota bacterium]
MIVWLMIAVLSAFAWYIRPVLPIDETRYLAVAYDMFQSNNYLVPHLNGELYSHKPPLLFWLITSGWKLFGLSSLWPRLLGVIALALNALLLKKLAIAIWPDRQQLASIAPKVYLCTFFPLLFSSLIFFDLWLSVFVMMSWLAIFSFSRTQQFAPTSLMLGLGIGFGILTKGPVILVFILPPLIFRKTFTQVSLFKFAATGIGLGLLIALMWAVPAAIYGGDKYRDAIFIKQTVSRIASNSGGSVSGATMHARPFWFFLALLPALMMPWTFIKDIYTKHHHPFLLSTTLPAILIFSLMSGKQPHYLLPLFPALALMVSDKIRLRQQQLGWGPVVLLVTTFAAVLFTYSFLVIPEQNFPARNSLITAAATLAVVAILLIGLKSKIRTKPFGLWLTAAPILIAAIHLALGSQLSKQYDMRPLAQQAHSWQQQGFEVAYWGSYHGQLNFPG